MSERVSQIFFYVGFMLCCGGFSCSKKLTFMRIGEQIIKEHRGYCYRIIFMKKNIFYHEKKYLSS